MTKIKLNELKELEKLSRKIEKKKQLLEAQLKEEAETSKWYDQVLKESEFKRPKDFIKALMNHFGIRTVSLTSARRGPGRPRKAATAKSVKTGPSKPKGRRKRTKITADVRDTVKSLLKGGISKNQASKKLGISYIVIKKIEDGAYDKL